jgi:hypothetical protein
MQCTYDVFYIVLWRGVYILYHTRHVRVKRLQGTRLAKAARALAYMDADEIWTGPVLESCTLKGNSIILSFDQEKLKDDVIQVLAETVRGIDLSRGPNGANSQWEPDELVMLAKMGSSSPMEVQINGQTSGEMSDGIWLPVGLNQKCSNTPDRDTVRPGQGACSWNYTSSTKLPGWDTMEINVDALPVCLRTYLRTSRSTEAH